MERKILIILFLFILIQFPGFTQTLFWEDLPDEDIISRMMAEMTDTQILGQLFLLSYYGSTADEGIIRWIQEYNLGGIKIFGRNSRDLELLAENIANIQSISVNQTDFGIPLFTATDQEGGWVFHVGGGTTITPGNIAIASAGSYHDAYYTGYYIGREIATLGINMNFAPSVDVYSEPDAHTIGPRTFSDDPLAVAMYSLAYYHGMEDAGIICTAKHYPGHGDTSVDSHGSMPVIDISEELWRRRELLPYRFLIREGLPAVMSGHLSLPQIEPGNTPATLSSFFLEDVLRDELGFEGLVITDDMHMRGVLHGNRTMPIAVEQAIRAGNDIIMLSSAPEPGGELWQHVYSLMQTDQEFRNRVEHSCRRILEVKLRFLSDSSLVDLYPEPEGIHDRITSEEAQGFFYSQSGRSIAAFRTERIPFIPAEGERVLLAGQFQAFFDAGLTRYPDADTYYFPYNPFYYPEPQQRTRIQELAEEYDVIVFCTSNPSSFRLLQELENTEAEVIAMTVYSPTFLRNLEWV
ncbi:MAG: glycoside hydrolase family 3 protein, partial [Spirochaetia bacterium]